MAETPEVQTEADELIRVLSTVPEMSIPDIAKQLRISESTVESISTFLEEEGLLAIQYKLTTPYVSLTDKSPRIIAPPAPASNTQDTLELSKDFSLADLEKQVEWLSDSWVSLTEAELISKTTLFLDKLSKIASVVVTEGGPLAHSISVRNELAAALRVNEEIKKHLQMGERSVAQDLFGDLILRLRGLIKKAHALSLMVQYAPLLPENSMQVMTKVRELVEQKRFEEAESLYSLLKQKATEFPKTFYKKELQFDSDLSQLNQDLFSAAETHRATHFKTLSLEMGKMLVEAKALIGKKEVSIAEQRMRQLRLLLAQLPDLYPNQKSEMESKVMRLQNEVLALKGTYHSQAFANKTAILGNLIARMDEAIKKSDMESAADYYRDMKTHFQSLPDSFPDRKMSLQQDILKAFERLTEAYKQYNLSQFAVMEKELLGTLAEMAVRVKSHEYESAAAHYHKIKQIFYNLPAGHLQRKVELQQDILSVFDVFKKNYPQAMLQQFMRVQADIKAELELGHKSLVQGDIAGSWSRYYHLLELFRRLPVIGPDQRREIRMHVLGFYRTLLQVTDQNHLKRLDDQQNDGYQRMLSLIMRFHDLVHERAFSQLPQTFTLIAGLFHELPLKIAQADTRLKHEIAMLGKEVVLYQQATMLEGQRKHGENEKANLNSQTLRENMVQLRTANPTDEELFMFVDQITSTMSSSLARVPGMRGKAPSTLPNIDTAMKDLSTVATQSSESKSPGNPSTSEVTRKIESLKSLAYPTVRVPS